MDWAIIPNNLEFRVQHPLFYPAAEGDPAHERILFFNQIHTLNEQVLIFQINRTFLFDPPNH
jgi:hypothetical protein